MENKINQNIAGLNLDSVTWQIKEGQVTFALNANIQSHDGNSVTYTNESSNQICFDFADVLPGFKIVGVKHIVEQDRVLVFLTHPDGRSEIGYISNIGKDCQSVEVTEEDCGCAAGTILKSKILQTTASQGIPGECPDGYTWNATKEVCEREVNVPATIGQSPAFEAAHIESTGFQGYRQPYLYDIGWSLDGNGSYVELTELFWTAPSTVVDPAAINYFKARAIRPGYTAFADNVWRGVTEMFCPTTTKTYHLGITADDSFRVFIDGVKVIEAIGSLTRQLHHRIHIYPLTITAGSHAITFEYKNSSGPDGLFYELYDATRAQVIAATTGGSPGTSLTKVLTCNIDYDYKYFNELSTVCPSGYTLRGRNDCTAGCFKMEEVFPVQTQVPANCCTYTPLIKDTCQETCDDNSLQAKEHCCLNFSIEHPIEAEYRIDNYKTRIYYVASNIKPKTFYWVEENGVISETLGVDDCNEPITCIKDACPKFDIFPEFCQPEVFPNSIESGGRLKAGVYSFAVAYSEEDGVEITDYLDLSNPIPIFERKITEQTEYETSKSIKVRIEHKTNNFEFFNLIVAENVNEVTNYHLVGTYRVNKTGTDEIVYSGDYKSTFSSIFPLIRTPQYQAASIIEKQNDILMLANLTETPKYNFQLLANEIKLKWETVEMPADGKFDYYNPEVAYMFRTYQRDEVYPFGIKFKLKNGKYTDVFHIPGRALIDPLTDPVLEQLPVDGRDVFSIENDCIVTDTTVPKWKVYNTAESTENLSGLRPADDYSEQQFECKIVPNERGEFAYWESTEKYPCNPEVWGTLSDQPIRFHKFPDSLITHIHDGENAYLTSLNTNSYTSKIYPIGVRMDDFIFNNILNEKDIVTGEYKYTVYDPLQNKNIPIRDLICGFELVRGNRVNNKSVIAKGLVYDVAKVEIRLRGEDTSTTGAVEKTYYYSNYPYNDLKEEPYLANSSAWYDEGDKGTLPQDDNVFRIEPFNYQIENDVRKQDRFTFYSPDTTFQYPKVGTELKLETIEYGKVLGHFVPVLDHPEYKYLSTLTIDSIVALSAITAYALKYSVATTVTAGFTTNSDLDISQVIIQTQLLYDLITKLVPYKNFAWQYNSIATYNNYTKIQNTNHKRRPLELGMYLNDQIIELGDDNPVHNKLRETSVYLKTSSKFSHQTVPVEDDSRYTISSLLEGYKSNPTQLDEDHSTVTYYTSVKRNFPNQYGQIQNIKYVSMGYMVDIVDVGVNKEMEYKFYPGFGGDTYINKFALKRKHSFFTRNLANLPAKANDVPFDYWLFPNLAYPAYYIGSSPEELTLSTPAVWLGTLGAITAAILLFQYSSSTVVGPPPLPPELYSGTILTALALIQASLLNINTPKTNLDNKDSGFYKTGHFYTASYGIPIFFVESDINVDFRHGRDDTKENFYPNVGSGIPDDWLHEINVPIKYDNFYHYNSTYSAQNQSPNLPYTFDDLVYHPNRVIYSSPASIDTYYSDAWKTYKRGDVFDFPKEGGRLIDLNSGENERVYARFENTSKIYNARVVMESTASVQLEVGDASMFKNKPLDITKSDLGFMGSQHKAIVKTEQGMFWVDAKRGNIYQLSAQGFNNLVKDQNYNWFKQNLPFQILKDFPNADIDNPAKGIGIQMGWDQRYQRIFITKLDYKLLPGVQVAYDSDIASATYGKYFYTGTTNEVFFWDKTVFENKSWTVAYSPVVQNFISFYSFLPNYYIPLMSHFQTVVNTSTGSSTWNHNLNPLTYQTYYNVLYPYILEHTANFMPKTSMVNSVTLIQDIQEYLSDYEFYSLASASNTNTANFTKAIVYNKEQSSGVISLVPELFGNTAQKISYPRMTANGIETILSRRENVYSFNGFWTVNNQNSGQPIWSTKWSDTQTQYPIDKVPNTKTVRPVSVAYQKQKIKSDFCKVRLIQDKYNRYKFINHLQITQIQP
jgi:hypothetical protein